jgi:hypothetical protein
MVTGSKRQWYYLHKNKKLSIQNEDNVFSLVQAVVYGKQNEDNVFIPHSHSNIKESDEWIIRF